MKDVHLKILYSYFYNSSKVTHTENEKEEEENGGEKGGDFNNLKADSADADASIGLHFCPSPRHEERSDGYPGGTCL